ncbi:MAG: DNA-binding response regulator [Phycisphaerales bacterium]|nr:MAG: DNA-binding response regulator [Phycisphaerales bacterium]
MGKKAKQHICFVDDEPEVRDVIRRTLELAGYQVTCFGSATECLARIRSQGCDLLVTDVKMPGVDGMELLTRVKRSIPSLPVLVVTGYGNVQMAVKAMSAGALSFIEKPLERESFLAAVKSALKQSRSVHSHMHEALTKFEMQVLGLILDGKGNKEIAQLRHRSVRTIEDQRRRIMRKFGVTNLVDLVKKAAVVRIPEPPVDA